MRCELYLANPHLSAKEAHTRLYGRRTRHSIRIPKQDRRVGPLYVINMSKSMKKVLSKVDHSPTLWVNRIQFAIWERWCRWLEGPLNLNLLMNNT